MIFNINAANTLTVALINLNIMLVAEEEKRKVVNYLTFSERGNEDINNFIVELEKTFAVNRVYDNRKYMITASCLKEIAANFYDGLVRIIE